MVGAWQLVLGMAVIAAITARAMGGPAALFFILCGGGALLALASLSRAVAVLWDPAVASARPESPREKLEHERELAVRGLKELEADAAAGKVDPKDLPYLQRSQEAEALDLIRRLRHDELLWRQHARNDARRSLGWDAHESVFTAQRCDEECRMMEGDMFCRCCGQERATS
ncbi:MAG: hypothetical protein AAGD10_15925 [Myxococcota bacterium]